jgi:hypothetical protein
VESKLNLEENKVLKLMAFSQTFMKRSLARRTIRPTQRLILKVSTGNGFAGIAH